MIILGIIFFIGQYLSLVKDIEYYKNKRQELSSKIMLKEEASESVVQEYQSKISGLEKAILRLENSQKEKEGEQNQLIEQRIQAESVKKEIYLTFDDGPSMVTEKILDILKKYQVPATFFVIHQEEAKYNDVLRRIANEGHSIGIHSYTHRYNKMYASVDSFFEEVTKLREEIRNITGVDTKLLRFPGGSSNTVSNFSPNIMTKLSKETLNRGYRYFDWNISSGDASSLNVSRFVKNSTATKGKSSLMLLMHDSSTKITTMKGLEQVIKYYLDNGYTFKKIEMYSPMFAHKISN